MMEKNSLLIWGLQQKLKPRFGETTVSLKHPILEAGVIIYQPKQYTIMREIPSKSP